MFNKFYFTRIIRFNLDGQISLGHSFKFRIYKNYFILLELKKILTS